MQEQVLVPFPTDEVERDQLIEVLIEQGEEPKQPWAITDKEAATWAVRQIAQARAGMAENQRIAQAEVSAVQQRMEIWLSKENLKHQRTEGFFTVHLERWHRGLFSAATEKEKAKLKTIKTPWGDLQLRAQQPEVEYDEPKLLDWVKSLLRMGPVPAEDLRSLLHSTVDQVLNQLIPPEDMNLPVPDLSPDDVIEEVLGRLRVARLGLDAWQGDSELLRVKEEVNKAELKRRIEFKPASDVPDGQLKAVDSESGVIVEGIRTTERPAAFNVKTDEGGK
jgi:hypothetical protein